MAKQKFESEEVVSVRRSIFKIIIIALALYMFVGIGVIIRVGGLRTYGIHNEPRSCVKVELGHLAGCAYLPIAIHGKLYLNYPQMYDRYLNGSGPIQYKPADLVFAGLGLILTTIMLKKAKK